MRNLTRAEKCVCWALDKTCAGGITKEHVISKSVLLELGNLRYKNGDVSFVFGVKSSVIRNLCRFHNKSLSKYDKEAQKLFSKWKKYTNGVALDPSIDLHKTIINTSKFEAWMLKTFINLVIQRTIIDKKLKPILPPNINLLKSYLFDGKKIKPPFGVYMVPPEKPLMKTAPSWSFTPQFQDAWHRSAATGIMTNCSSPTVLHLKLGLVELIGFFNLTGMSDEQALDLPIKRLAPYFTGVTNL